jgi:flagellar basal body-associated protein FliL
MAKKKAANSKMSTSEKVGLGLGLTAAAVTAAGAYFLYGSKESTQNRKKVKGWVLKAKGEVLEALEKAKTITEEEYNDLVASATGAYGTMKNATAGEVKDFKKEMHDHWMNLQKNKGVKKVMTDIKKPAAKKAPKKKAGSAKK